MNTLPGSIRHDRLKHGCNWLRQHVRLNFRGTFLGDWVRHFPSAPKKEAKGGRFASLSRAYFGNEMSRR